MFLSATVGKTSDLPFEEELDLRDFLLLEDAAFLLLEDAAFLLELLATVFLLLLDCALLLDVSAGSTFLLLLLLSGCGRALVARRTRMQAVFPHLARAVAISW